MLDNMHGILQKIQSAETDAMVSIVAICIYYIIYSMLHDSYRCSRPTRVGWKPLNL